VAALLPHVRSKATAVLTMSWIWLTQKASVLPV